VEALKLKHKAKLSQELATTLELPEIGDPDGLARLLYDERIWTGAEIERVFEYAKSLARLRSKPAIGLEEWNRSMKAILPKTGEIETQIKLALYFLNNLDYCPPDWVEMASKRDDLKSGLKASNVSLDDWEDRD
jgi:hypothetical protein